MNEIWKDIKDYEGRYQVSNLGRVKSLPRIITGIMGSKAIGNILLKQKRSKSGYMSVNLRKNGKGQMFYVHRLVADAFIKNPNNLPQINHKDENKSNNFVENLEWCTGKYNANYGTRNKRSSKHKMKKVGQYTKEGVLVKVWDSITTVQKETGMSLFNISMACTGKIKTAFGYIWKYEEIEQ